MNAWIRMCIVAILVASLGAPVFAQRKPKPTAAQKEAQAHFLKGREYYNFGAYGDAIREYEAAYALAPLPEILFNIGQVHRANKDREKALEYYRRYVAVAPTGTGAQIALAHISALEAELAAEAEAAARKLAADEAAQRLRADEAERLRTETEARARQAARSSAEIAAKRRVEEEAGASRRRTARVLKWSGAGVAGLGAAALGVGGAFGLKARSLSRDASEATGTWSDDDERAVERAESAQRNMYLLVGTGGVLLLGGTALYVGGWRMGRSGRVELTVHPGADGGTVSLGGSF